MALRISLACLLVWMYCINCTYSDIYTHYNICPKSACICGLRRDKSAYHYENTPIQLYWKFHHPNWKFSDKNSDIFHISAQNMDCGYSFEPPRKIDCGYPLEPPWRGGSNEYPQSMFLIRNKKNNVYPCEPQFYYIKVGFKGVKII